MRYESAEACWVSKYTFIPQKRIDFSYFLFHIMGRLVPAHNYTVDKKKKTNISVIKFHHCNLSSIRLAEHVYSISAPYTRSRVCGGISSEVEECCLKKKIVYQTTFRHRGSYSATTKRKYFISILHTIQSWSFSSIEERNKVGLWRHSYAKL